jgi:hypothetical protein
MWFRSTARRRFDIETCRHCGGQKAHSTTLPLFASLDQNRSVPFVNRKSFRSTSKEIPKADADSLRHSLQWQK